MQKLVLIGDPKFVFPESRDEMNIHCKNVTRYEKCIKDYSQNCLETFPRQVTGILAFGIAKTNKGYCTNQRRKDSYIAFGKCANFVKPNTDKCMFNYIDNLQGIENYPDNKLKIPLACCNFFVLKDCILNLIQKNPQRCTDANYVEIERIIDGYAVDTLNLLCNDYTEDSDKCGKLLPQTPKKLATQKRLKSLLPPFISILASV